MKSLGPIENVSGTAFVVAELRAEENVAREPLYEDPVVGLFLNEETRIAAARVAASFPPVKDLVRIRTKYLDDTLDQQLHANCRQVVILGAGLDTRAIRKSSPGVIYFEIDDPATLTVKKELYREYGFSDIGLKLIPGNYVTDGLIGLLERGGVDFALPTYFIWEGNTMYLPMDPLKQIVRDIRATMTEFRLSFDYMAESVITRTTGDPGVIGLVESFARMGAPWLSGIADVRALARELRLDLIENFPTSELFRRYWPTRPIVSPIFNLYSVCTLGR